ncbi:MAG TPA: ATP-dependent DNA helicase [Candidatus Saccharimonadales bacterium]|nr:ATP-dependent DNA helicase [Candidatus Saccharimonadales bacterium]
MRAEKNAYEHALQRLNKAQRGAVETVDGPVLVIAGPGTGKTQLLGVRVAHILAQTDTLPQNILCLTFTENGAENMRERLSRFIGQAAYDVTISTYHAFGGDLIRRYPEVFAETRAQQPADELTRRQILRDIVEGLSYKNPLKQLAWHLGDLVSTVSEVKRALLSAESLRAIAGENSGFITAANAVMRQAFDGLSSLTGGARKVLPPFEALLAGLEPLIPRSPVHSDLGSLANLAVRELTIALEQARASGKTTTLTAWKNAWLAKDEHNRFVFDGELVNRRIEALASVFEAYQAALTAHGWYDFDDMILRAIDALEKNADLRYSLQEQYLYVLLDEFQDTNAAQLRLVQLLTDNPVHEGRPNVLAVGDDDQAIYAFQGAQYSNMLDFYQMYRDVTVVHLAENYRSHTDIITTAENISTQITARLKTQFSETPTSLRAAKNSVPARAHLERREFLSDVAQYDWIARQIKQLVDSGTPKVDIAVLAPKHKQLEPLVPYLAELGIPMRYEKRENILEAPVVRELITMSKLVLALSRQDHGAADALWPQVLSFEFWELPLSELWQLSWQIADQPASERTSWTEALLRSSNEALRTAALLLMGLSARAPLETCEQMLDYLIGTDALLVHEPAIPTVRSPLRAFYTGQAVQLANPSLFYDTVSHLTVLRARLRDHQAAQETTLTLAGLINFIEMYEAADERMLNTSPYNQQADAVQLMTVFKAKGLEFAHVFLPSMQDDVWGSTARGNSNKLTLPANLAPIRHAGATDDERLRILFVAITRAKIGLHLTSFARTYSGKTTRRLKYLDEQPQPDGSVQSTVLPKHAQTVVTDEHEAPSLRSLELNWRQRHEHARTNTTLQGLLQDRLKRYQLSPTHLTYFIDLEYGGPEQFFFRNILRFPEAPTASSQFGDAIHATLEWTQHRTSEQGRVPGISEVIHYFTTRLARCTLTDQQRALEQERGEKTLAAWLANRGHILTPTDRAEHNFKNEGVFVGEAHLAGKVDRMEINPQDHTITVVDYKTGRGYSRWEAVPKLHKYQLQLYCYKLLIEGSHSFKGYTVTAGRLEFVEPDDNNLIHTLELSFKDEELTRTKALLMALWQRVHRLDFPQTQQYSATLAGMRQFEDDLINTVNL